MTDGRTRTACRTYDPRFLLRAYVVEVLGFPASTYHAASRGQAIAAAWNDYNGAQDPVSFRRFLEMAKARSVEPGPRFGERIMVGGREAFYVGDNGHYVQFALPGSRSYCNSHRADVQPAT